MRPVLHSLWRSPRREQVPHLPKGCLTILRVIVFHSLRTAPARSNVGSKGTTNRPRTRPGRPRTTASDVVPKTPDNRDGALSFQRLKYPDHRLRHISPKCRCHDCARPLDTNPPENTYP